MALTYLKHSHCSDILFPEEDLHQHHSDESYYSPPSTSNGSSYSHEIKYIFDPQLSTAQGRQSDSTQEGSYRVSTPEEESESPEEPQDPEEDDDESEREATDRVSEEIYSAPRKPYRIQRHHTYCETSSNQNTSTPKNQQDFINRRKTWSPPTFNRVMGSASSSFGALRNFHSNEQLDTETSTFYVDDVGFQSPPKLAPTSGILANKNAHKSLVKPIAFKPVVPANARYVSAPRRTSPGQYPPHPPAGHPAHNHPLHSHQAHSHPSHGHHHARRPSPSRGSYEGHTMRASNQSQDSGYLSQDSHSAPHSHSNSNLSQGSMLADGVAGDRAPMYQTEDRLGHHNHHPEKMSGVYRAVGATCVVPAEVSFTGTPSPSDSGLGLGELEALLRAKDQEIIQLRQTMEHNEMAIFQVQREKQQVWEVQMAELREELEGRLRAQQQKAFRTEQALLLQLCRLQQERKTLRSDLERVGSDRDQTQQRCSQANEQLSELNSKLEEAKWDVCQKAGEISLLKSQLKEAKEEAKSKSSELANVRSKLKEMEKDKCDRNNEMSRLQEEVTNYKNELDRTRLELDRANRHSAHVQEELSRRKQQSNSPTPSSGSSSSAAEIQEMHRLRDEIKKLQSHLGNKETSFVKEKDTWLEEKNKVIRYQKHLQLNYIQMCRKNKTLEREVEQLTLELEHLNIPGPAGIHSHRKQQNGRIHHHGSTERIQLDEDTEGQVSVC